MIFRKNFNTCSVSFIRFHIRIIKGSGIFFVDCPLFRSIKMSIVMKFFKKRRKTEYFFTYTNVDLFVCVPKRTNKLKKRTMNEGVAIPSFLYSVTKLWNSSLNKSLMGCNP